MQTLVTITAVIELQVPPIPLLFWLPGSLGFEGKAPFEAVRLPWVLHVLQCVTGNTHRTNSHSCAHCCRH